MENLHTDDTKANEKQAKIAFSGKVLPTTSQEFEKLFKGIEKEGKGKLQFEDKLLMLIDAAREKFADDKLQLEEKVKKSVEFDLEEEKSQLESLIGQLNDLVAGFEGKAKRQLASFKNTISNEVIVKAQKENQNTLNLLDEFRFENDKIQMNNTRLQAELLEKDEMVLTLEEQLRDTAIEHLRVKELLEKCQTENEKCKAELSSVKEGLSSMQVKFNSQLEKNDLLRDEKEQLEIKLSHIESEHSKEVEVLRAKIEELTVLNNDLEGFKVKSEEMKVQLSDMSLTMHEKDNEINELKADVKVSQKEIEMLKENLIEVKDVKVKLEAENKELNTSMKGLEVDYNVLMDNNKQALTKIKQAEVIINNLKQENANLKNSKSMLVSLDEK